MIKIIDWLKLTEAKKISNLDDINAALLLHREIIQKKLFLKKLYIDFYNKLKKSIPGSIEGKLLVELGSGGGFIKDIIPEVITSDVIDLPWVDEYFSVLNVPFDDETVDAYFMVNVLHHIEDARKFFKELNRSLKIGGKILMIEQANTIWSRFIFKNFHHEPFDPNGNWGFRKGGRLSSANGALGWIIFYRDRAQFEKDFPALRIVKLKSHTPLRYIISGGLSFRQFLPSFSYSMIKGIEWILTPLNNYIGMFVTIELEKL